MIAEIYDKEPEAIVYLLVALAIAIGVAATCRWVPVLRLPLIFVTGAIACLGVFVLVQGDAVQDSVLVEWGWPHIAAQYVALFLPLAGCVAEPLAAYSAAILSQGLALRKRER